MTTRTAGIDESKPSARALVGTTLATLALLGGALLWQARPARETAAPEATERVGAHTANEGGAPAVTDAEMYQRGRQAAARVTTNGTADLDGGPVTDQAMYQAWQQRTSAGR